MIHSFWECFAEYRKLLLQIPIVNGWCAMNAQPNSPEHPEETARRNETEHRDIVDSIPATADQGMKLPSQPDVEALRRTERELRDLVENMPAMAGVLLPDGSHTYLTN